MSDLTTYRIVTDNRELNASRLMTDEYVIPDTRLQAIADAWKTYMDTQALREDRWVGLYTLRGKVFDLLDELGGTDNEPI